MAEPEYHRALIRAAQDETALLRRLWLELPPEVLASHTTAGQYVKVRAGSAHGPLALASAPGLAAELLVKRAGALGEAVASLEPGSALELTTAKGPGFPLAESRWRDLLLFATGSGIGPIRAALQAIAAQRDAYGTVTLFYGVRTRAELAYQAELEALAAHGIRLLRSFSGQTDGSVEELGRVQQRFARERPAVANAVAFLCGQPEAAAELTALLVAVGIPAARIHQNF